MWLTDCNCILDLHIYADIAFAATFATVVATENFDLTPYAEVNAWFDKVKGEIPNYEKANGEGAKAFGDWFISANTAK